jgi:DNA-binding MarR family transcriptional regulator
MFETPVSRDSVLSADSSMQPTASNQSSLRCPLNEIFCSKGQIRLLRVLATETTKPIPPSEVATRAGMTESGARKGLQRLLRTGLVARTEDEKGSRFALNRESLLAREVARLFEVERDWGNTLVQTLKRTLRRLPNPPTVAWVRDCQTGRPDSREVAVYWEGAFQPVWLEELEERMAAIEGRFESALEIRVTSRAEMEAVDGSQVVMLLGPLRADGARSPADGTKGSDLESENGKLNPESSEFSGALVALLEENLSVLQRARENVRGRLKEERNGNGFDLWEWQKILDTFSLPKLLNFLGSESPRALRLRECSPFPAVLSEEERARLAELASRPH